MLRFDVGNLETVVVAIAVGGSGGTQADRPQRNNQLGSPGHDPQRGGDAISWLEGMAAACGKATQRDVIAKQFGAGVVEIDTKRQGDADITSLVTPFVTQAVVLAGHGTGILVGLIRPGVTAQSGFMALGVVGRNVIGHP